MNNFKKIIRLVGLVVLLILASFGVGFGAVVPPAPGKKEDEISLSIESEDNETELPQIKKI